MSSTPLSSRIPLGKRTASTAGLESAAAGEPPATVRRTNLLLQHDLERRLRSAQARELELQSQLDNTKRELDSAKDVNRRLVEDDAWREEDAEKKRVQQEEEKKSLQATVNTLRSTCSAFESENLSLSETLSSQQRSSKHSITSLSNDVHLLKSRLEASEQETRGYKDKAEEKDVEVKSLRAKVGELVEELEKVRRDEGEEKVGRVLREELHRQSKNLHNQDITMSAQKAELVQLRQRRDDVEALRIEMNSSERAWADKCRQAEAQVDRLRSDLSSITSSLPSPTDPSETTTLQAQLRTALAVHQEALSTISSKETELNSLHSRLETLSQSSRGALSSYAKKLEELERELRLSNEGRKNAETRLELVEMELKGERKRLETGAGGGGGSVATGGGVDQARRVEELEGLVKAYKERVGKMEFDSREAEKKIASGLGYVKRSEAEELRRQVEGLNREITDFVTLRETNDSLTAEIASLTSTIELLERRVAAGEYNPETFKCLSLSINPSSQDLAVRTETLDALKRENQALLDQLAGGTFGESVPRVSYDMVVKEKEEFQKQAEKRLLRLKEVFKAKSQEFLDTLYSLLGYRINFSDNGDVRMNSTYAPKGKSGLTFRFTSQEGHFGTMQATGAMMTSSIEALRDFWVTQRQDIPCFLAAVTLELYDLTTTGKAVGWVRPTEDE
ncbi:spindle assembly checkpoint component Mad1 [Mrakia frigida]|uniref:spindle assembly checkpoint component Mad1 n=1 Tax=Mrakia frigida TaxID=29902 RepID=UPI003FCC23A6